MMMVELSKVLRTPVAEINSKREFSPQQEVE
jgi:hypothetical protein